MKVSDEWVGAILLAGLPDQYKLMIMRIESSGIKVTADVIKTKLLQDIYVEKSKKGSAMFGYGNKNSSDSGTNRSRERKYVIADSSSYTRNGSKGTGKGPRCYKCNRYAGHIAKNCDENSSKKQVFVQKSDKSEFTMFTALSAHVKSTRNDWFLDSGCSAHLTVDKSNFIKPDHESDSGPPIKDFSYEESDDDSSSEEPPNLEEDLSDPDFILSRQTTSLPEQHLRRGDRIRRPPQTHDDYVSYTGFFENFSNPTSVEEVLASPDKGNWLKAMDREYKAQIDNGTFSLQIENL
ncbi:hypothetical protein JTB14_020802 [Gonioctena quinquepunctata]|nr:hypothetical protein JTB14_020802 [Gonioctena quinquepunctata]